MCRLRIWDYILSAGDAPDREIVHSHDFNRYLTPFRAEWDPKDAAERTIIVGRCLPCPSLLAPFASYMPLALLQSFSMHVLSCFNGVPISPFFWHLEYGHI